MSQVKHHANGVVECPRCEEMLLQAHPRIVVWFRSMKKFFPDAHISESFRDKAGQDKALAEGKSEKPWPQSKHNRTFPSGHPAAEALDIFRLNDRGAAAWPWLWFQEIADWSWNEPIRWGGTFKTLVDGPHFELDLAQAPEIKADGPG